MYQHGRRTRQPRNAGVFLATIGVVAATSIVGWWIVHADIGSGTGAKTTVPIVTEVGDEVEDKLQVNESTFSMELPSDWRLLEYKTTNDVNAYIYRSTIKGAADRTLYVHVNVMPPVYKLVRLQPVTPNANKLTLGNLSSNCVNFSGGPSRAAGDLSPFEAKWENVPFICDPVVNNQTIGTGTVDSGIRTTVGRNSYFFYYEDHNVRPNDKIFQDALRSFVAK